jgi:metal-sulfur cluster biosynthetic enzyme
MSTDQFTPIPAVSDGPISIKNGVAAISDSPVSAEPKAAAAAFNTPAEREEAVLERMREVVDPELMVNVVDLGLVYGVTIDDDFNVTLDMTLTTPACPLTDQIEWGAEAALSDIANSTTVNWVWLPPWSLDMITDDGREQLRYIGYNV